MFETVYKLTHKRPTCTWECFYLASNASAAIEKARFYWQLPSDANIEVEVSKSYLKRTLRDRDQLHALCNTERTADALISRARNLGTTPLQALRALLGQKAR